MAQPCHFHGSKAQHLTRDCNLLKNLKPSKSFALDQEKKYPAPDKSGGFPEEKGCLIIFGGSSGYESKRSQNLTTREVNVIKPAVPQWLRWSESTISFDRSGHPNHIPHLGRFPLMVDPLVSVV